MQRWAQQRCIVSNCVVYAKIWDTPLGYPIFFYAGGTRTAGESLAASPSAASGGCSEGAACAAVGIFRGAPTTRENTGHRKRTPAP